MHIGPAKVNEIKIFSQPYYMLKRVLTFVSGVQQGRRENFRAPGQKIRLGPLVSGAPKTHD